MKWLMILVFYTTSTGELTGHIYAGERESRASCELAAGLAAALAEGKAPGYTVGHLCALNPE